MATIRISQADKIALARRVTEPYVRRTAAMILGGSRVMAPRGNHESGSGKRQPGQTLQASLRMVDRSKGLTVIYEVGSEKNYAATVHQGSQPHFIRAKGKLLTFEWERGTWMMSARRPRGRGRRKPRAQMMFYFRSVHHPGNKRPVRYLTTPMHLYGRLRGFKTTSIPVSRSRLP